MLFFFEYQIIMRDNFSTSFYLQTIS